MAADTITEQDYLLPEVRALLYEPLAEKIKHVESDHWICYEKADDCLSKLDRLLHHPKILRMPNLLIIGATNNGKSMIIEKFRKKYPKSQLTSFEMEQKKTDCKLSMPVLVIQMPAVPSIRRFCLAILNELELRYSLYDRYHIAPLEREVLDDLKRFDVRMLVIDEIHNILAGPKRLQIEFLNLLRFLGNSLQIPLVGVGTKEAYLAIRSDPQLENRFEPFILPTWTNNIEYKRLLSSFVSLMPLGLESKLAESPLAEIILERSEGIIGEMARLIKAAAIWVLYTSEVRISERVLRLVDFHSPSKRKQMFEDELIDKRT